MRQDKRTNNGGTVVYINICWTDDDDDFDAEEQSCNEDSPRIC